MKMRRRKKIGGLAAARLAAGLSAQSVADLLEIKKQRVRDIESGRVRIRPYERRLLASIYNFRCADIEGRT